MPMTFDDIRSTMPERAVKDDATLEKALSVLPARLLLLAEAEELGVVAHRFDARMRQAAKGEEPTS
jgi:hypothetical protein